MPAPRKTSAEPSRVKRPLATTPEAREQQLTALAVDLAEKQLAAGTASAQVITHYLKIASAREALELEGLRQKNELTKAQIDNLASAARVEELYKSALNAMKSYTGETVETEEY